MQKEKIEVRMQIKNKQNTEVPSNGNNTKFLKT